MVNSLDLISVFVPLMIQRKISTPKLPKISQPVILFQHITMVIFRDVRSQIRAKVYELIKQRRRDLEKVCMEWRRFNGNDKTSFGTTGHVRDYFDF